MIENQQPRARRPEHDHGQRDTVSLVAEAVAQTLGVLDYLCVCDKATISERVFKWGAPFAPLRQSHEVGENCRCRSISYNPFGLRNSLSPKEQSRSCCRSGDETSSARGRSLAALCADDQASFNPWTLRTRNHEEQSSSSRRSLFFPTSSPGVNGNGQAVIGLVGVVVGALLSGGATYLMARRTEARGPAPRHACFRRNCSLLYK